MGLSAVRRFYPSRKLGEVKADFAKDAVAIDEVESILEVHLKDTLLLHRDVLVGDEMVQRVDDALATSFYTYSDL